MDRANNQFATAIYKRHERPRTGGGVDSPQWQWHLLPEPVVSSCGPVASLQTIHTNRVESVSGARMQAIFVMLNHQDMCHEKYVEAPCNWQPDNRSQNWVIEISRRVHGIWNYIFTAENLQDRNNLGRPQRWWQNTPMDVKEIGSEMRSAFSWLWIWNASADDAGGGGGSRYK